MISTAPASSLLNDPGSVSYTSGAFPGLRSPMQQQQTTGYLPNPNTSNSYTSNCTSPSSTLPLPPQRTSNNLLVRSNLSSDFRPFILSRNTLNNSPSTYIAQIPPEMPENMAIEYSFQSSSSMMSNQMPNSLTRQLLHFPGERASPFLNSSPLPQPVTTYNNNNFTNNNSSKIYNTGV